MEARTEFLPWTCTWKNNTSGNKTMTPDQGGHQNVRIPGNSQTPWDSTGHELGVQGYLMEVSRTKRPQMT